MKGFQKWLRAQAGLGLLEGLVEKLPTLTLNPIPQATLNPEQTLNLNPIPYFKVEDVAAELVLHQPLDQASFRAPAVNLGV